MTPFFIPGMADDRFVTEDAYLEMRRAVEVDTGRRPRQRRILQLWSRRGGVDCLTEVGRPDPLHGGTVLAIFDLGAHQPFVVQRQRAGGNPQEIRDVLSCNAYSVLEFER
jgi:hypothetical protein